MLEQTNFNGAVYSSTIKKDEKSQKDILISRRVDIPDIRFGPPTEVTFYLQTDRRKFIVQMKDTTFTVENGHVIEEGIPLGDEETHVFFVGYATYENDTHVYFIKNTPVVEADLPSINPSDLRLPTSFTGFPYDTTFQLPKEILSLLAHAPCTLVDRFKRPLRLSSMKDGRFFPMNMEDVSTTLGDVVQILPSPFPVVINFFGLDFAVIDLEPGHTQEDYDFVNDTFDWFYREETPRGGFHFLVRTTEREWKYRLSPVIEVINDAMITLYGINSVFKQEETPLVSISAIQGMQVVSRASSNKKVSFSCSVSEEEILTYVELVEERAKNRPGGRLLARQQYEKHKDLSSADFWGLYELYKFDVAPVEEVFPKDVAPFVLATYARSILPYRTKHDTARGSCDYLTYQAGQAILNFKEQEM